MEIPEDHRRERVKKARDMVWNFHTVDELCEALLEGESGFDELELELDRLLDRLDIHQGDHQRMLQHRKRVRRLCDSLKQNTSLRKLSVPWFQRDVCTEDDMILALYLSLGHISNLKELQLTANLMPSDLLAVSNAVARLSGLEKLTIFIDETAQRMSSLNFALRELTSVWKVHPSLCEISLNLSPCLDENTTEDCLPTNLDTLCEGLSKMVRLKKLILDTQSCPSPLGAAAFGSLLASRSLVELRMKGLRVLGDDDEVTFEHLSRME